MTSQVCITALSEPQISALMLAVKSRTLIRLSGTKRWWSAENEAYGRRHGLRQHTVHAKTIEALIARGYFEILGALRDKPTVVTLTEIGHALALRLAEERAASDVTDPSP